jgi:hypothetical protein
MTTGLMEPGKNGSSPSTILAGDSICDPTNAPFELGGPGVMSGVAMNSRSRTNWQTLWLAHAIETLRIVCIL